ncbi:MAG: GbsR/MarR family transcriptional regulator [Flavobacteriales bacterium]
MKIDEAKARFIQSWGALGTQWGINRTMAQIHALLLVAIEPMTTEQVMEALSISRGNANMNLRALIDWQLVERLHKLGERKEYFEAEKDIWKVATRIAGERRKRELQPVIETLSTLRDVEKEPDRKAEIKEFRKVTKDVQQFAEKVDQVLDKVNKADEHWFLGTLLKVVRS